VDVKHTVLLVDDEEELAETLVERLEYRGFEARYATSGKDALEILREDTFDVVVVDLKLPGMSGDELVQVMRKAYPNIPIVVITGHGSDSDAAEPEGAYALLPKPFDITQLVLKMQEAIEHHES